MIKAHPTSDVIVVGGGPAGVATAVALARAGQNVRLCEARTFAQPQLADLRTGEVLSPGAQRELAWLGFPCEGSWRLDDFDTLHQFWTPTRTTRHTLPAGLRYWQSDRRLLDRALLDFACANGVDVQLGFRVHGVSRDDAAGPVGGVTGRRRESGSSASADTLRARLVVDASGRNSPLLVRLGLKVPEIDFHRFAVVCFFSDVPETVAGEWEQHFMSAGNTTLNGSRMGAGLYRYTLETDMGVRHRYPQLHRPFDLFLAILADIRPTLAARFQAATAIEYATAYAPIGYRVPRPVQAGLIMVGDAAGYLDPATGQGIELALRMARLAAHTADRALRSHQVTPEAFAAYEVGLQREIRHIQRDLRLYLHMTRHRPLLDLASRLRPLRAFAVRRLVMPRPMTYSNSHNG